MSEWKYTFPPVSKADWLARIEQDLKSQSIQSTATEWWPGEPLIPFIHKEDVQETIVLPDSFYAQPPRIVEWMDVSAIEEKEINTKILSALQFGAQTIIFENVHPEKADYSAWLKGVHLEMIGTGVQVKWNEFSLEALSGLPANASIRLQRMNGANPVQSVQPLDQINKGRSIKIVYTFTGDGNWVENTANVLKNILSDFEQEKNSAEFFDRCILVFEPGFNYIKQIIQTRTLQLLWLNILDLKSGNKKQIQSPVELHVRHHTISDPDKYLIRASASALAASLTGVQSLCIHPIQGPDVKGFYERMNRDIHHLLHLESGMYKKLDPLAGAYALDYYTFKWAREILDMLRE